MTKGDSALLITAFEPSTWQDLQSCVANVLKESGFDVEEEKVVSTPRGNVEIDVYAAEKIGEKRRQIVICECKYWESNIPQGVIHAFRTVVGEIGANTGYVIAKTGFQKGAYAARELTNIELVTWRQFQSLFFDTWYFKFFSPQIEARLDPLLTYTEPILPAWYDAMSEPDKERFIALKQKYDLLGAVLGQFGPWMKVIQHEIPRLPLIEALPASDARSRIPPSILEERYYRDFLEAVTVYGREAISEFRSLRDKYYRPNGPQSE